MKPYGYFAAAALLCWMLACGSDTEEPTLKADIGHNSLVLQVTNNDSRDWTDVDVAVNTDSVGVGGFKGHLDALKAGEKHLFMLSFLVDKDGNRFDPRAKDVISARVDAQTSPGKPRETAFVKR